MGKTNDNNRDDLDLRVDTLTRTADLIHSVQLNIEADLKKFAAVAGTQENRRYALDQAVAFFKGTTTGVVSAEAALHCADMFFQYAEFGTIPDAEQSRAAVRDYVKSVVQGTFPSTIAEELE